MSRTPGPWALRGHQIRAAGGLGAHVADYRICEADGRLLAAAPELLGMLLDIIAASEATGRDERLVRDLRAELARLKLVRLGTAADGIESVRVPLAELDP